MLRTGHRDAAADPAGRRGGAVHFIFLPGGGLLDHYLGLTGHRRRPTGWAIPSLALGSIIAITVWKNTGYYMLFFLAGLAGIPEELLDAAKIDGAGAWQRFVRVTLPLLGPDPWRSC